MSSAIAAADPTLRRQLEKAELLHRKAVHENANGHAARGEQLIRRGLQTGAWATRR
jgi:hypothetical protein